MKQYMYPITVECLEEGGYYAECPILQGCHVEGETFSEVMENIEDAIKVIIKSYRELGKEIPRVPMMEGNLIVSSSLPVPAATR